MFYHLKKAIIRKRIAKKAANSNFNLEEAEFYVLPPDASGDINNSHYFTIPGITGNERMFLRSAKRGADAEDEVWLTFVDADGNVFINDKDHIQKGEHDPVTITAIEPGVKIAFRYDGTVKKGIIDNKRATIDENSESLKCLVEGEFIGKSKVFEFTQDLDPTVTASCIAREKDLKNVQNAFEQIYQVHYEQGGLINMTVTIGDKKYELKDCPAVRDHSYGRRVWDFFNRYIWSVILTEDGNLINTSYIRYPVLDQLNAGFIINEKEKISLIKSGDMDDLPMTGRTPDTFEFKTAYADGTKHHIEGKLDFFVPYYFVGEFLVNEGFCDFLIDGKIKGKGIGEFAFCKDKSRWVKR